MDLEVLILFGIFFGVTVRIFIPAWRKYRELLKEGKPFHWNHFYTGTLVLGLATAVVSTFIGFANFPMPELPISILSLFIAASVYGFGLQGTIIEVLSWNLE